MTNVPVPIEKLNELYRLANFGNLALGLFHDLMQPLTLMVASIDDLAQYRDELSSRSMQDSLSTASQASRTVEEHLGIIRTQMQSPEHQEEFSLNTELENVVELLRFRARAAQVYITINHHHEIVVHGHPVQFHHVILNLLTNAIDSYKDMPPAATEHHITATILRNNTTATITITDCGAGIPKELLNTIFEPFFTTKESGYGIGLGLSSSKHIVERIFNGTLTVHSTMGKGTTCTVTLPINTTSTPQS